MPDWTTETVESTKTTTTVPAEVHPETIVTKKETVEVKPDLTTVTTVITETRTTTQEERIPEEIATHKPLMPVSQERRDSDLLEGVTHILEMKHVSKLIGHEGKSLFEFLFVLGLSSFFIDHYFGVVILSIYDVGNFYMFLHLIYKYLKKYVFYHSGFSSFINKRFK